MDTKLSQAEQAENELRAHVSMPFTKKEIMNTPDPRALRAWETRRANMEGAGAEKENQKKQKGGKDTEQKKPAVEGKPLSAAPNRASRELAFKKYGEVCAHCGFSIKAVLEVAHIDCNRRHNDVANLAILCPNCHKMS